MALRRASTTLIVVAAILVALSLLLCSLVCCCGLERYRDRRRDPVWHFDGEDEDDDLDGDGVSCTPPTWFEVRVPRSLENGSITAGAEPDERHQVPISAWTEDGEKKVAVALAVNLPGAESAEWCIGVKEFCVASLRIGGLRS